MRWPWRATLGRSPVDLPAGAPESDAIRRGEHATRLLQDPVLAGAFEDIRRDLWNEWLATEPHQTNEREELYRVILVLERVRLKLRSYRSAAMMRVAGQDAA